MHHHGWKADQGAKGDCGSTEIDCIANWCTSPGLFGKISHFEVYLSYYKEVGIMDIKVILEKDEDGFFVATVPALPGCISQGKTERQALQNIKEAIELHVHTLAEDGLPLTGKKDMKETMVSVAL
jgi:predicted RNase H-like HicB family nuclease